MGVRDESIVYFDGVLKILGVCHGILGGLLIVMGVVVRLAVDHWTSVMLLGLWIGVIVSKVYFGDTFTLMINQVWNCETTQITDHNTLKKNQHDSKGLFDSSHLNGHTLGFQPQTQKFEPNCTAK